MGPYLNVVQIIVSIALIALVIMQRGGQSGGSMFGASAGYQTRRGVEKTLYNMTLVISVLFLVTSLLSVLI